MNNENNTPVAGSVEQTQQRQMMQGMADCMDMVHGELIEMGVISKDTAPMFIPEAIANHIKSVTASAPSVERNAVLEEAAAWHDKMKVSTGGSRQAWMHAESARAIRALKAAPVDQPLAASAVPEVSDYDMFAAWKAYPLDALDSEGRFEQDWINREFIAFKAGRSALAAAPRQEAQPERSDKPAVQPTVRTYSRDEVQNWRSDVARAAAAMVERASPAFGDGDWGWLHRPSNPADLHQRQS